jgi:hypothetical protein
VFGFVKDKVDQAFVEAFGLDSATLPLGNALLGDSPFKGSRLLGEAEGGSGAFDTV